MSVVKVSNLSKSFGGIKAVTDVSLEVGKGEIIGLIGPNGAGKTTFFNLLTGIYLPTDGEIEYDLNAKVLSKDFKPHRMTQYGVARTFQNIRLFNKMTVLDNCLIGFHNGMTYGVASSLFRLPSYFTGESETREKALKLLEKFDLLDKKDILATNLPYGDQRRLEIARALDRKSVV